MDHGRRCLLKVGGGVENGGFQCVASAAVELVGSALGDDADLAACGAAVFGRVVGGEHLSFLRGIDAGYTDDGAVGAGTDGRGAIECNQGVLGAGTVYLEGLTAADGTVLVAEGAQPDPGVPLPAAAAASGNPVTFRSDGVGWRVFALPVTQAASSDAR